MEPAERLPYPPPDPATRVPTEPPVRARPRHAAGRARRVVGLSALAASAVLTTVFATHGSASAPSDTDDPTTDSADLAPAPDPDSGPPPDGGRPGSFDPSGSAGTPSPTPGVPDGSPDTSSHAS